MDQVKEAIKITEKKLKADLGNHLKEAKGYLSSTINLIQHGDYEDQNYCPVFLSFSRELRSYSQILEYQVSQKNVH